MFEFAVAGLSDPVQATVPWLSLSILVPIVGALLIPLVPDAGDGKKVRWYALIVTLITFLITVAAYLTGYDPSLSGLQLSERVNWLPDLGLTWAVGADGLSMPLILLTSFITSLACLAAWPTFQTTPLLLPAAGDGWRTDHVFAVQDMLLFFLAWELELIPVYLLLAIWEQETAICRSVILTAGSSLFILSLPGDGVLRRWHTGFEYTALATKEFGTGFQLLLCRPVDRLRRQVAIVPLPWLPDAHGEATAPVHMLLAGLLKMGGYALLRFNCQLLPAASSLRCSSFWGGEHHLRRLLLCPAKPQTQDRLQLDQPHGHVLIGVGSKRPRNQRRDAADDGRLWRGLFFVVLTAPPQRDGGCWRRCGSCSAGGALLPPFRAAAW